MTCYVQNYVTGLWFLSVFKEYENNIALFILQLSVTIQKIHDQLRSLLKGQLLTKSLFGDTCRSAESHCKYLLLRKTTNF